jgi:hypothetical protein
MATYLECISASDYRVYQPLEYQGAQPNLPLWVGHVIRSGVLNKDPLSADTYPKMIGTVLGWLTPYFLSFIDDKDIQAFDHTAWSLFHTDGSSATNDGEFDFNSEVARNKVDEEYLYWLDEEAE